MADRPAPYIKKDPGDIMLAADWNEMQVLARADIEAVRTQRIDAARLDAGTSGLLTNLTLTGELKVPELKINGDSVAQRFSTLESSLKSTIDAKLDRAGGTIGGTLTVGGSLTVNGDLTVNGTSKLKTTQVAGPIKLRTLTTIEEGNGVWANFGSNAYFDGGWRQVDANRPGVNLHMNAEDGAGQEFRFFRLEKNGGQQRNIAVLGTTLSYLRESNFAIGSDAAENSEGWGRVLDVYNAATTKLSVRAGAVDSRVTAHTSGFYNAPAGMIIGTRSAHPVSLVNGALVNMTLQTKYVDLLCSSGTPLRLSSGWTGKPDGGGGWAEISNDIGTYKTLMIIGNKSNDGSTRRVSVWDRLEVNGSLEVTKGIVFENNLSEHIKRDGVLYRYNGQAYLGVDDHFYVYDWSRSKAIHLDVANSVINGARLGTPSDLRLKEDVATLANPLDTVRKLRGVSYLWKDGDGKRDLGLIAQEVEQVLPELVSDGPNGMKQMSYMSLIPLLLEAIKAQQAQIDQLASR
ncbi:tail fiber domain-containing protein [Chitiniphilus eburneus]|uniref:Tail fiber domain-containing protein n=1 Tax=Chitiniphilus eburneus TaxID=2571148 RepID=A0A4U0PBG4_9NEIS|nr:tail fiber domain-containing protein [Chitiniphilus eburneus]TJZ64252.1 tail fiber domain-containing protein [Chitiniphilus eburneus]